MLAMLQGLQTLQPCNFFLIIEIHKLAFNNIYFLKY